ncbi:FGGY-family carbohydrate kinase [Dactylosporangium sp. CA-092794]|uniref:FGGY-family carbohydrate kinase n=1 Tax=Dactylosporangium sp. CA-092794 TaxID=3239929 RepID=UPI003D92D5C5
MPAYTIGIDLGTTATKTVLVDGSGAVVAGAARAARVDSPAPGHAEMDPHQWWSHVAETVAEVLAAAGSDGRDVAGIGVSGMVPTLVAVDAGLRVLHPSIQQNDARAVAEIDELARAVPDALARTGSAVTAQSIGPKWHWLARHRPRVAADCVTLLGSYGWVIARLTGERVADENWALESGLAGYDSGWQADICAAAGLDPALLPPIRPSGAVVGSLRADVAAQLGLPAGVPVTAGYADHVVSAFAAGLLAPGDTLLKLGGAGDILAVSAAPVFDPRLYLDRHPLPGYWMPNGCMATSGATLRWFQRELAGGRALGALDADADAVGPGAGGVLALPYFLGEKTPVMDPLARGAFVGLHLGHTRAHLYRALVEAVAFGFAHHVEVFAERGIAVDEVRVTNGGSRSALWKQTLADTLDRPLGSIAAHPGSSWGAALLTAGAVGLLDPAEAVRRLARVDEVFAPSPAAHRVLRAHYERYGALREALAPISHDLAAQAW